MNDEIAALILAALLAFIVRFFNVVLAWLARVLGVDAPEPIGGALEARQEPPAPVVPPDSPTPL